MAHNRLFYNTLKPDKITSDIIFPTFDIIFSMSYVVFTVSAYSFSRKHKSGVFTMILPPKRGNWHCLHFVPSKRY